MIMPSKSALTVPLVYSPRRSLHTTLWSDCCPPHHHLAELFIPGVGPLTGSGCSCRKQHRCSYIEHIHDGLHTVSFNPNATVGFQLRRRELSCCFLNFLHCFPIFVQIKHIHDELLAWSLSKMKFYDLEIIVILYVIDCTSQKWQK